MSLSLGKFFSSSLTSQSDGASAPVMREPGHNPGRAERSEYYDKDRNLHQGADS